MEPREFFETLESRVDASKTAGMNNSYVFDIEGAGVWKVDVADGSIKATEGATDGHVKIPPSGETVAAAGGDVPGGGEPRAEPHYRLHDRQAEDRRRHGRGAEAPEALLSGP